MTLVDALKYIRYGYKIENKITHKVYWWDGKNIRTKEGPVSFDITVPEQLEDDHYKFIDEHILSKRDKAALRSALCSIPGRVVYIEKLQDENKGRYYIHLIVDFEDRVKDDYYSDYIDATWFSQMKLRFKYSLIDLGLDDLIEGKNIGDTLQFHKGK